MPYSFPAWRYKFSSFYSYRPIPYGALAEYLAAGRDKSERPLNARVRLRRAGEGLELLGVFCALYKQQQQLLLMYELPPLDAHDALLRLDAHISRSGT